MSISLSGNISVLKTLSTMRRASTAYETSSVRLSTGKRINKIKDGSSGYAIANRISTTLAKLEKSNQNTMDAISLVQTADGALEEITSILQSIREIAVQSNNDTFSYDDKLKLQQQSNQLMNEINSIINNAQYNGINLLNGNSDRLIFNSNPVATVSTATPEISGGSLNYDITQAGLPALFAIPSLPTPIASSNINITSTANAIGTALMHFSEFMAGSNPSTTWAATANANNTANNPTNIFNLLNSAFTSTSSITQQDINILFESGFISNTFDIQVNSGAIQSILGIQRPIATAGAIVNGNNFSQNQFNNILNLIPAANFPIPAIAGDMHIAANWDPTPMTTELNNTTNEINFLNNEMSLQTATTASSIGTALLHLNEFMANSIQNLSWINSASGNNTATNPKDIFNLLNSAFSSSSQLTQQDINILFESGFINNTFDIVVDTTVVPNAMQSIQGIQRPTATAAGATINGINFNQSQFGHILNFLPQTNASGNGVFQIPTSADMVNAFNWADSAQLANINNALTSNAIGSISSFIPKAGVITINGINIELTGQETGQEVMDKIIQVCNQLNLNFTRGINGESYISTNFAGSSQQIEITSSPSDYLSQFFSTNFNSGVQSGTNAQIDNITLMNANGTVNNVFNNNLSVVADGNIVSINSSNNQLINLNLNVNNIPTNTGAFNYTDGTTVIAGVAGLTANISQGAGIYIQTGINQNENVNINIASMDLKSLGLAETVNGKLVFKLNFLSPDVDNIGLINKTLDRILKVRNDLGSFQNRFESITNNLDNAYVNLRESNSRTIDADMALEMSKLSSYDVIRQAAMSMLAQANQKPQQILTLLR